MKRAAMKYLIRWKENKNRKPLIIKGARQVGKTWLMKEFGKKYYEKIAYINFENAPNLKNIFATDYHIDRIILALEIETGIKIESHNTLIIFDEIQEVEKGLTALKYFYETAPQYHILAAGSSLGISLHKNVSFPVGKVDFLQLYPLTFIEFLEAVQQNGLQKIICEANWELMKVFKNKLIEYLKIYLFTGGMPEVVQSYIDYKDFHKIRDIQKKILMGYELDFSKHAPIESVPKIRMLWQSIPGQLSKENKKFIYSAVKKGARAKDFEVALNWLRDSGLVYKIHRIKKPALPLSAYEDFNAFKLYLLDAGLLGAMTDLSPKTIINENKIFEEFKGTLTEQYVLQELKYYLSEHIYYWAAGNSRAEIDFIFQYRDYIYPVEVKAKENLQSKSLKFFYTKYPYTQPLRISMSDYRRETWLTNIPLYAVCSIFQNTSS